MLGIFAKARAGENLSPAARSFLRLAEGLLAAAIVAALPVVSDALSQGTVNWADVGRAALAAGATAALLAFLKYAKAHADAPLTPAPSQQPAPTPTPDMSDASASQPDPFAPIVLPADPDLDNEPVPPPAPAA